MGRLIDADATLDFIKANLQIRPEFIIEHAPTVEAIPKADYENRLKADFAAMLEKLKSEIDEIPINVDNSEPFKRGQASAYDKCEKLIQQKINALIAESEDI